jgi:hypothetical protein
MGQGCLICRANRAHWYNHGRNLKADLAWAKAVAPDVDFSYDQWVATLTSVFFVRQRVPRVILLKPAVLEHLAASDSFGCYVHSYEI